MAIFSITTSDSNSNPRNTKCMDACPAVFKRGGYNFRLPPPLKVRDFQPAQSPGSVCFSGPDGKLLSSL